VTAISFGAGCVVAGEGYGVAFQAYSGQECTLSFPEGPRRLRLEAFSVSVPPHGLVRESIRIDLSGVDPATGRYAAFHFDGSADQPGPVPDDPCPTVEAHLGPGLVARP
jgi:hypothetical protein